MTKRQKENTTRHCVMGLSFWDRSDATEYARVFHPKPQVVPVAVPNVPYWFLYSGMDGTHAVTLDTSQAMEWLRGQSRLGRDAYMSLVDGGAARRVVGRNIYSQPEEGPESCAITTRIAHVASSRATHPPRS